VESKLENKLRNQVARRGGLAIKFYILEFTGFPDRIVLMPGARIYFVELKSEGKTPKPRQKYVHRLLKKYGFTVHVIDSESGLINFLTLIEIL
jgi:hypothetical protein